MYKVIVAEDETKIRRALLETVQWNKLGFEVIGEAENGRTAFELIKNNQADLLITDVEMPYMNGLELLQAMRENGIDIKTVIISGYSEFRYAVKAIEYGVASYLLKPLEDEKLKQLLLDIKSALDSERKKMIEQENMLESRNIKHSSIVLSKVLKDCYKNPEDIEQELNKAGVFLNDLNYAVFLLSFDDDWVFEQLSEKVRMDILHEIVSGIENGLEKYEISSLITEKNEMLVLIQLSQQNPEKQLQDIKEKLIDIKNFMKANRVLNSDVSMTIGVSSPATGAANIKKTYMEAKKAVENRVVLGKNKIISYRDICGSYSKRVIQNFREEEELINYLCGNDKENLNKLIDMCFDEFSVGTDIIVDDVHKLCIEIAVVIEKFIFTQGINMGDIFESNINWLKEVKHFKTIHDIKVWLKEILFKTSNVTKMLQTNDKNQIIEKSREYIKANLMNNIGLNDVADSVYLSPNYFSNTFKQVTGENFSDYIIRLKIEKAKQMIRENQYKIYRIASMLGYQDIKYFSKLFKKEVGVTPAVYREMVLNSFRESL